MKKHFKKICSAVGLSALLVTGTAMAAWSNAVTITGIEVDPISTGSQTYLRFSSTPTGKPGCGTSAQVAFVGNADQIKAMTSLATAAFLSGKTVKVYWDGTCTASVYANVTLLEIL